MKFNQMILATLLMLPLPLLADSSGASEFGESWKNAKMSDESFYSRFKLTGEIFLLSASGKQLISPTTEVREWQAGLKSRTINTHWSVKADGYKAVALKILMELKPDKSIDVHLQQYDSFENVRDRSKPIKYGKLLREEKMTLENFAPITWVAETTSASRVVLRLTPSVDNTRDAENLQQITIGGDRGTLTITDNQGYLWGDQIRMGGVFSGITSHRGSFLISYYPFKGGKEIGTAQGKEIILNLTDELQVKIRSETDLIPGEMRAKVYGKYTPGVKTSTPNSSISFGQTTIDTVQKELR